MTRHTGLSTAPPERRLEAFFGITPDMQRRIGTIVVLWSLLEMKLEHLCWLLCGETFPSGKPTTDKLPFAELHRRLEGLPAAAINPDLASFLERLLRLTKRTAELRHALVHGVPLPAGEMVHNPRIFGEERSRSEKRLVLADATLDSIAGCAEVAGMVAGRIASAAAGTISLSFVALLETRLDEAIRTADAIELVEISVENT